MECISHCENIYTILSQWRYYERCKKNMWNFWDIIIVLLSGRKSSEALRSECLAGEWLKTFQLKIKFRLSSSYWIFTSAGMAERKVRGSWAKTWSNFNIFFLNYRISQLAWFTSSSAWTFFKTSIMDWKHSRMDWKHSRIIFVLGREEFNWTFIVYKSANNFFLVS